MHKQVINVTLLLLKVRKTIEQKPKEQKIIVMEFSAKQIAEFIQGIIVGDENATVHTFAKIEEGVPGALSFLANPKYTNFSW